MVEIGGAEGVETHDNVKIHINRKEVTQRQPPKRTTTTISITSHHHHQWNPMDLPSQRDNLQQPTHPLHKLIQTAPNDQGPTITDSCCSQVFGRKGVAFGH